MAVQSALTCSDAAATVRSDLAARRAAGVEAFRERFDRAQLEGDMPSYVDTQALAQDAGITLSQFEYYFYGACLRDWEKESEFMNGLLARTWDNSESHAGGRRVR